MMYGFIEMSDDEVMLSTCSKIDIPPKPSKKLHRIMFKEITLNGILEIKETPFVSSIIPEKNPFTKLEGIFKVLRNGDKNISKISKILVLFKIEIITLKSITNPPIITMVLTEFIMLRCIIAPKLLKLGAIFLLEEIEGA